jgi:hypothetical protein
MAKNVIIAILGIALIGVLILRAQTEKPIEGIQAPASTTPQTTERACIQVITPAVNPATGEIREFPTPCDVPDTWERIQNDIPELELNLE